MFSYYGSKKSVIGFCPPPKHSRIIEPFAGAATYAMKYWQNDVVVMDKYEVVFKIWKWLQGCQVSDINQLPHFMEFGDSLDNYSFDCEEAKLLMGFIIAKGVERPRTRPTERATTLRPNTINFTLSKIKQNLHKIKHWTILHGDYKELENERATWFIDPPYQFGGNAYVENKIDFTSLSDWCKSRKGQVIVCENTKADWLPFKPVTTMNGTHKKTTEAIWTNLPTSYGHTQTQLNFTAL